MTGRVLVATGFGPARDLSEVHANFDDRSAACPFLHTSGARTPVATKIKLMRLGKMREPHYRIVVADARTKRDGRAIETIGEYHPKSEPSIIKVDADRAAYWLGVGAQPTEAVAAILRATGDWQKYKGLPEPSPLKLPPAKPDKLARFNSALAETTGGVSETPATTPRKRPAKTVESASGAAAAQKADADGAQPTTPDAPATDADNQGDRAES
jgi:small subunit ribosomal protein S16